MSITTNARWSLRDRQVASIKKILNFNQEPSPDPDHDHDSTSAFASKSILTDEGEPIWKVLVFDDLGRDVISSVLRVPDIRNLGVTVHVHIKSVRHAIPDVPVVYLVEPTEDNVMAIVNDLAKPLYEMAYVNFLSPIPRPLLEMFAAQTAEKGCSDKIARVYDQYLNFVLEAGQPDLFSLQLSGAYFTLNSRTTPESVIDSTIDRIVGGLFAVAVTMGSIPIIRCPKGNAAEMIAKRLDRKLRDYVLNDSNRSRSASASRPVLVILDRNIDLVPMLSHSWSYQSLVNDILSMRLNRIVFNVEQDGKVTRKSYDLSPTDTLWTEIASLPFPEAAGALETALDKWRADADSVAKKTGVNSLEDLNLDPASSNAATHLKAAITQLPELRERKATLDMHMTCATEILKQGMQERNVAEYFELESSITRQTKAQMLAVINDPAKKNAADKLRAFIIWYLSSEGEISKGDMSDYEAALTKAGCDLEPLAYVKKVREITRMTSTLASTPAQQQQQQPETSSNLFRGFSALSSRLTDRLMDSGLARGDGAGGLGLDNLIAGVRNLLPADRDLTVTKVVEALMDPTSASSSQALAKTEHYLYFDPRSKQGSQGPTFGQRRQGFAEAIVTVVGGGAMEEYANLQEWSRRSAPQGSTTGGKKIVYGSTDLLSAEAFMNGDLKRLGQEQV